MSKARLVITAMVVEGRSQSEGARTYGVSQSWISRLVARYRAEGDVAFEPRSRRPQRSPTATDDHVVELIVWLRKTLDEQGLDAGAQTICWHLEQHHHLVVSTATVWRILHRHAQITPQTRKRPRSSYLRFEAAMPNQMWQTDFTHYRLATGADVEILNFLDDHSRLLLACLAFTRVTGPGVVATVRQINAEIEHIPEATVQTWQRAGPHRVKRDLADRLRKLAERDLLDVDDPDRAALNPLGVVGARPCPAHPCTP